MFLAIVNAASDHKNDLDEFYRLIGDLESGVGGMRPFNDIGRSSDWPMRGVYLLFEKDEVRTSRGQQLRVTRIGTHAIRRNSRTTLLGRLKAHRGYLQGGGNHRGSVLRKHVGRAILNSLEFQSTVPTWDAEGANKDERRREQILESRVSEYIGNMQILWLKISDEPSERSDRAFIEKNAIALLTLGMRPCDIPSQSWLGNFSPEPIIRRSGLWNLQHSGAHYDSRFIRALEEYVEITVGRRPDTGSAMAPIDWY